MSDDQKAVGFTQETDVSNTVPSRNEVVEKPKWYIVHTYSGYEKKVQVTLEQKVKNMGLQDQFPKTVVPVEKVPEVVRKKTKDKDGNYTETEEVEYRDVKIFPSYVFIKMVMSDDNQNIVRSVRGCTGFVGLNSMNATEKVGDTVIHNAPPALSDEEVGELKLEAEDEEIESVPKFRFKFKAGDVVRVTAQECPFEDPVCTVEAIDEEKNIVTVIGNMFGRRTRAEVSAADIEVVE